jgi:hypothetical protein
MSASPVPPVQDDRGPTEPVTLGSSRGLRVFMGLVAQPFFWLVFWLGWPQLPYRARVVCVAFVVVTDILVVWMLWRRPTRVVLGPAGITANRRQRSWSSVVGIDVEDGLLGRHVKVRVSGRRRPIVLAAPWVDRGLRERPRGTDRFEAEVAEVGRWVSAYAPGASFRIHPSGGATAIPLILLPVLGLGLALLALAVIALSFV